tara:strand:- start:3817 stop:4446 length:630 start_codon:yes stop_codon:yes gene_type:complete
MQEIDSSSVSHDLKYVCIDDPGVRKKLPSYISNVPTIVVGSTDEILIGDQINCWLRSVEKTKSQYKQQSPMEPQSNQVAMQSQCNNNNDIGGGGPLDPNAWHTTEMNAFSDQYSFLDVDTSANGNGGLSMLHNFELASSNSDGGTIGMPGGAPGAPSMPVNYGPPSSNNNNGGNYGSIQMSQKAGELNKKMEDMINARSTDVPYAPSRY